MNVLATLIALFFSSIVAAKSLHNIVVFGDSLSDNGNLYEFMDHRIPLSPPYYEGRFTNGPVWVERLANAYFPDDGDRHLQDYAFGGAGIAEETDDEALFTLQHEIDSYLLAHEGRADPHSLFIIWIGANNYLAVPDDMEATVQVVNKGIKRELARLANVGARHILILNLPDLGKTPAARDFEEEETLSQFSKRHNEVLASSYLALQKSYPGVQWLYFDVEHSVNEIMSSPGEYGFKNIIDTCYDVIIEKPSKQSILKMASQIKKNTEKDLCGEFMFFDLVHCTAPAHQILAERIQELLTESGVRFDERH